MRTIRFGVRLGDRGWELVTGEALPKMKTGTVGELVVPAYCLMEEKDREVWTVGELQEILPGVHRLWVRVRCKGPLADDLPKDLPKAMELARLRESVDVVPIDLKGSLRLEKRPGKLSKLMPCSCHIPSLKRDVDSVNEAYARISEAFETHRRSHGGNVFTNVFFEEKGLLRPLDLRR